jgi:hypothetical protein
MKKLLECSFFTEGTLLQRRNFRELQIKNGETLKNETLVFFTMLLIWKCYSIECRIGEGKKMVKITKNVSTRLNKITETKLQFIRGIS